MVTECAKPVPASNSELRTQNSELVTIPHSAFRIPHSSVALYRGFCYTADRL